MSQTNYEDFQELVEQFEPEMSLKAICEQEGVSYRSYISWRKNHGLGKPRRKRSAPTGLVEVEVEVENVPRSVPLYKVTVQMEFENGLRFSREGMEVESLIEFLTKIKPVLCLS